MTRTEPLKKLTVIGIGGNAAEYLRKLKEKDSGDNRYICVGNTDNTGGVLDGFVFAGGNGFSQDDFGSRFNSAIPEGSSLILFGYPGDENCGLVFRKILDSGVLKNEYRIVSFIVPPVVRMQNVISGKIEKLIEEIEVISDAFLLIPTGLINLYAKSQTMAERKETVIGLMQRALESYIYMANIQSSDKANTPLGRFIRSMGKLEFSIGYGGPDALNEVFQSPLISGLEDSTLVNSILHVQVNEPVTLSVCGEISRILKEGVYKLNPDNCLLQYNINLDVQYFVRLWLYE